MNTRVPAGPSSWNPMKNFIDSKNDSLGFYTQLAKDYGDVSRFRLGHKQVYFINHPEHIDQVLRVNKNKYNKDFGLAWAKKHLGEGLIMSEGKFHLANRKAIQPAFDKAHLEHYASQMLESVDLLTSKWKDQQVINLEEEMLKLSIIMVGRHLFGLNLIEHARKINWATSTMMEAMIFSLLPGSDLLMKLPIKLSKEVRQARAYLYELVDYIIEQREKQSSAHSDFITRLFVKNNSDEEVFSHQQKQHETITILLAGHETTSTLMTWAWYCLAKNPEVQQRLSDEAQEVIKGTQTGIEQFRNLKTTYSVVNETLRLYPPVWFMTRMATDDDEIGGYPIPKDSVLTMSQYVTQRDARFFDRPEEFIPERWMSEEKDRLSKLAFFPFGGGLRKCIGDQFATIEAALSIAAIAKDWKIEINDTAAPDPAFTLRPNKVIVAKLSKR